MSIPRRTIVRALTIGATTAATLLAIPTAAHASRADLYSGYDGHPGVQLPAACTQANLTGGEVTCTYRATGGEQYFDVPKATTSTKLTIDAIGAAGGSHGAASGGAGGRVKMNQTFKAGQRLYVEVGTPGQSVPGLAGAGGFNGGGGGAPGHSGGGGATDIRTISRTSASSLTSRLLVAGGGGGGCRSTTTWTNGGAAGHDGIGSTQTTPGRGATNGPGVGGHNPFVAAGTGQLGQGGTGAITIAPGCGGGGGWYGGGGSVSASGAGGGSNYPLTAPASTLAGKDAVVVIRYTPALGALGKYETYIDQHWVISISPGTVVTAGTPISATMFLRNADGAAFNTHPVYLSYLDRCCTSLVFTEPGKYTVTVKAFWAGSNEDVEDSFPVTLAVLPKK